MNRGPGPRAALPAKAWWTAALLLLVACAGVPVEQLEAYDAAFAKAREASNLIYVEMQPALAGGGAAETSEEPFIASLGPGVYSRNDCPALVQRYTALLTRCEAMNVVAGYNAALTQLASGAGVERTLQRVDQAFAAATTLAAMVPDPRVGAALVGAQALFPPIRALLGEALQARNRAELRDRLNAAAPDIGRLIEALQEDVGLIFTAQRAYYVVQLEAIQTDVDRHVVAAQRTAVGRSAARDPSLATLRRSLDVRFDTLFDRQEPTFSTPLSEVVGPAGAPPFDARAAAEIGLSLDAVEEQIGRFDEATASFAAFRTALGAYDALLRELDVAFETLLELSNDRFAPGGAVDQFTSSALAIREHALEIENQLSDR